MPAEPLLLVRDLSVDLGERPILSGVSLRIAPGRIVGLCGDSGCGKTTLALALMRLLPSPPYRTRGAILFEGRDLTALSEREMTPFRGGRMACIFQDPMLALNPVLSVRTQIAEILRAHGVQRDPAELLALCGLPEPGRILAAYPHQLSGGERQRVTIAQALAARPALVIADEPFTALDAPRVVELAALFRELRDRTAASFLIVSHSPGVLSLVADEVLRLHGGSLLPEGAANVL
jgi:ABC-type glutathione transport system ATPase component